LTRQKSAVSGDRDGTAPKVGLFGKLGSGNIGNDASMEAVLRYLRVDHPEAEVDALCTGAEIVAARYGIPATPLFWYHRYEQRVRGSAAIPLKVAGKCADIVRTAAWVRRHDAVIVPGMGVLEASLPLRPWEFPYAMFLLSISGRLFGTKVALVSVGAGRINQRWTRWLFNGAAKLAFFRSYRNAGSREAMRQRGLDVTRDPIYPDLAFALPDPDAEPTDPQTVCVGLMAYYGSNDDRKNADQIYSAYVIVMKEFVRWLADNGRKVRLLVGDTNGSDDAVVREILADLQQSRPTLDPSQVTARPVLTLADVLQEMRPAGSVVAIRFHNILAALKLCKPTVAIGYSAKHDALMADMGVPEFCEPVSTLNVDRLIQRFTELESRSAQVHETLVDHKVRNEQLLKEQFAELSDTLFPAGAAESAEVADSAQQSAAR
jgi:polysaccharide pyruvyl transferase WcaK-like protein